MKSRKKILVSVFGWFIVCFNLMAHTADSAEFVKLQSQIDIYEKIGNFSEMGKNLNKLAILSRNRNQYQYLEKYTQSVAVYRKIKILTSDVAVFSEVAAVGYYINGNYDSALIMFKIALELFQEENDQYNVAKTLSNIGLTYNFKGKLIEAMQYTNASIKIFEKLNSYQGIAIAYHTAAIIQKSLRNYDKCLKYNKLSLNYNIKSNNKLKIGDNYTNIGVAFDYLGNIDSALYYFNLSQEYYVRYNNKVGLANALNNIGDMIRKKGDLSLSYEYYQASYLLRIEMKDYVGSIIPLINLGEVYQKKGNFHKSLSYFNKAVNIADSLKLINLQIECYSALYKFYTENGLYKDALNAYIKFTSLNDTLLNIEKVRNIQEIQIAFDTERKQNELLLLKSENQIQRVKFQLILLIIIIIVIIAVSLFLYQKNKQKHKTISLTQKLLRSQMNPHFIFNSLFAIQNYMFAKDSVQASIYLSDFARLIRLILDNSREEYITFEKEIQMLTYYLNLQKLRFNDKFDYKIIVDENIDKEGIQIPPMMAQPIIENAIEHGIREIKENGLITINYSKSNGDIQCIIQDNGIGINKAIHKNNVNSERHKPVAINILKERLSLHFSKNKCYILTEDLGQQTQKTGTRVTFLIPVKNERKRKNCHH